MSTYHLKKKPTKKQIKEATEGLKNIMSTQAQNNTSPVQEAMSQIETSLTNVEQEQRARLIASRPKLNNMREIVEIKADKKKLATEGVPFTINSIERVTDVNTKSDYAPGYLDMWALVIQVPTPYIPSSGKDKGKQVTIQELQNLVFSPSAKRDPMFESMQQSIAEVGPLQDIVLIRKAYYPKGVAKIEKNEREYYYLEYADIAGSTFVE